MGRARAGYGGISILLSDNAIRERYCLGVNSQKPRLSKMVDTAAAPNATLLQVLSQLLYTRKKHAKFLP